jgi:long-chain acyl-CoA synthetase
MARTDCQAAPTLSSVLLEDARRYPDKIATAHGAERITFPQLAERVDRLANALAAAGFGAGDRLLWMGQGCHRALECLLAAGHLGGMFVAINWRQTAAEQEFVFRDLEPLVVMWQKEELDDVVAQVRGSVDSESTVWVQLDGEGADGYEAFLQDAPPSRPPYEPHEDDPVLVIYTAAFDGRSNGALITHRNILSQTMTMAYLQRLGPSTVWLAPGPLFHIGNWITALPTFVLGGTNVFVRKTDAVEMCEAIHRERCTDGYVLPPVIPRIVEVNRDGRYDLSCLRSSVEIPEWQAMVQYDDSPWGRKLSFFGQTEVFGIVTHAEFGGYREALGTTGVALPFAQVRVVGEDDREVPQGEVGEIVARGPMICSGYWNRPELNVERVRSGWWHTRDLGRCEPDGSIAFVAPKTRLLKSGNENIYPVEVERCLESHRAVKEAAVIGVPHETWTQSPKAIVVLAEGASVTSEELIEHCRTSMAHFKRPHSVEFVTKLPRRDGRTDYETLDRIFGGGGYPGGATRVR